MQIKIISVGKLKEDYLVSAVKEYIKRLSRYTKLEIIEIKAEQGSDNISTKDISTLKDKEAVNILRSIKDDEYVFLLELAGKQLTSEDFADKITSLTTYSNSKLTFVIGGTFGNGKPMLDRANFNICFSKMTFTHQLIKVFLLEQVYRAFKIINNETYHR